MPVVPAQRANGFSVMMNQSMKHMQQQIQMQKHFRWEALNQIQTDCMICMEMLWSGVWIIMDLSIRKNRQKILRVVRQEMPEFPEAEAGEQVPMIAGVDTEMHVDRIWQQTE